MLATEMTVRKSTDRPARDMRESVRKRLVIAKIGESGNCKAAARPVFNYQITNFGNYQSKPGCAGHLSHPPYHRLVISSVIYFAFFLKFLLSAVSKGVQVKAQEPAIQMISPDAHRRIVPQDQGEGT